MKRVLVALNIPLSTAWISALLLILLLLPPLYFLLKPFSDATGSPLRGTLAEAIVRCRHPSRLAVSPPAAWRRRPRCYDHGIRSARFSLLSAQSARNFGTFLAMQIVIAAVIAPAVTAAMLLLAVALFAITKDMVRRSLGLGAELTVANADLLSTGGEMMNAMKLIKATGRGEYGK